MADQKLLYTLEGDATGLKKAMADSEAAFKRLTDAMTRKRDSDSAIAQGESDLKKIEAAAAKAGQELAFFRRSAEIAPGGIKQFSKDIDKASKDLARLASQARAKRADLDVLRGASTGAGADVVSAQASLDEANSRKRIAQTEAERQARVNYGNQVLASLRTQAAETERVAAIERRRAADEAANARAAQASARVRIAAQQSAAQAAQAAMRLQSFAASIPRFDIKGNAAAKLAEINAAAARSKVAFNEALVAARNFGNGGASQAQGFAGQLKSLALQAVAVTSAIKGIGAVVATGIQSQRLEAKFQFSTGGDTAKAASDLAYVRAEAERLALPLFEAADGFTKLSAATQGTAVEGEKTRQIFTGISSAMRVLGAPAYQVERAFNAVMQAISKGNLQAEEIRGQLTEHIPGAFSILARALDITEEKLNKDLKQGLINGADAMVKFGAELERMSQSGLLTATKSFQAQMVRLQNSLFDFRAMLADAGILDAFGDQITALTEKLREMSDTGELQQFARDFASVIGEMARILGAATMFIIEHRNALASLAALYAGFKVAKAVQAVGVAWSATAVAMAGAGTAAVGLAGKLRILLALFGGPVGITVAILAAAAAWLKFGGDATNELDAVIERQRKLNALQGKGKGEGESKQVDDRDIELDTLKKQLAAKKKDLADAEAYRDKKGLSGSGLVSQGIDKLREEVRLTESAVYRMGMDLYLAKTRENTPQAPASSSPATTVASDPVKPDKKAIRAAESEAKALAAALQKLDEARLQAEAQRLEMGLDERRALLEQRRKAELINEADFIAAKAVLDEEGLRNELSALQEQQAKLRAVSGNTNEKGSVRANADAELVLVEARIQAAQDKILNVNQTATASIAQLGADKLNAQLDFIEGLEQEAFLADLNNDARETALLLLEAEKLGITDVNRLLELQGQIRQANADKEAAEELQRQQDDLYESVQQGVQRAFADGLNAVATGEGGIREALYNIVGMIRNALSNALAASLTDSFLGMLGGKEGVLNLGGMFGLGGGKKGDTAANPVYVKDVNQAAGLLGGDGESGGLFGGLGESFQNMFSGIGSMLSNLFSGLMSGLTSMLSGLGGGMSSLFSGIGGLFGFADGGYTGAGGKYQPAGVVHAGEYVFSAESVRRLGLGALDNLHRIAKGGFVPTMPRFGYAEGGLVDLPGSAAPTVNSSTKVINMFDLDSAFAEYLNTRHGERAILNVIQRNPNAARG